MGLLDLFGSDASSPGALYGGLLTPQQNQALAYRGLLAAAGAFGQAAMPSRMPIPIGAALGSAAAAMGTAQDTSGENALKGMLVGLQGKNLESQLNIRNQLLPIAQQILNGSGGVDGGAVPAAGGGEVGPPAPNAKVSDGGIGAGQLYSFLTDNGATPNEAAMLTSAANSESSFRPDITHDGGIGYGLFGHNTDRLAAMRQFAGVGPNDPVPWQKQALFALNELHGSEGKAGAMVNAATTPEQLTDAQLAFERPNLNIAGGNRAQRLASTREYMTTPPGAKPVQVAQANTGTATDAVPDNSTGSLPTPGMAGVPQRLLDAARAAPTGAGPLPAPSPQGGLLPSQAPAVPPGMLAPQAPGSDSLRLGGAVAPQTSMLPPTATPFTNAPPVNGVGAPAPGPQGGLLPPQPPQVAQAAPPVPAPSGAPGMSVGGMGMPQPPNINPRALAAGGLLAGLGGMPDVFKPLESYYYQSPGYIAQKGYAEGLGKNSADLPFAGPIAGAKKNAENQSDLFYKPQIAGQTKLAELPYTPFRPGGSLPQVGPNGEVIGWTQAPAMPEKITVFDSATGMGYPSSFTPSSPFGKGVPNLGSNGPQSQMPTTLGKGIETSLETRAKAEQESRQQTIDAGSAAQSQQATLLSMKAATPNFYVGPFADHVNEARKLFQFLPGGDKYNVSTMNYDDFTKNAGSLTRQAVHDTSPRAAVQEFKLIGGALPHTEMANQQSLDHILNEYMGLNDYRIAKTQAQNMWESQHGGPGNVSGFETDWQSKVSPYAFIMMRMAPADRQRLFAQVGGTKEGQAELQHLAQQMQYIQQSGLEQFIR